MSRIVAIPQELSFAEVKAIASGNPAVLTLAEADAELQRLSVLKKHHADEQYLARRSLRELPETISRLSRRVADLEQNLATVTAQAEGPLTVGDRLFDRQDLEPLGNRMKSLLEKVRETGRFHLGAFRGLKFGLIVHPQGGREVYLEGATTRETQLSRESQGPRAVMNALERLAGSYESQAKAAAQELAIAQAQLRDHQARLGIPFPHDAYFAELARLRDELKAALSEAQAEPGRGPVPPAAEPAERIEALRAAHAIEPLPERTPKRRGQAAESPVTTRIRERTGISSPEPKTDFFEFPAGPTPFPEGTRVRFQEFKLTMFSFPRSLPLLETVRKLVARSSPPPTH